jgi:hypothetical protein
MRLFAYGGTRFVQRQCMGEWPEISTMLLDDKYGLASKALVFGCGTIDKIPFLIIRQAQERGNRFYPFTLLLDPGVDIWEDFGWNAASLALALFRESPESEPASLGLKLLEQPESFTEESLESSLLSLSKPRLPPENYDPPQTPEALQNLSFENCQTILDLWVAATVAEQSLALLPENFGFKGRPSLAQIESLLWLLPPCFRVGLGWLIGGHQEQGKYLGARLILDDWMIHEPEPFEEALRAGQQLRSAWRTVNASAPVYSSLLRKLSENPIGDWQADVVGSPENVFHSVALLAETLKPGRPVDEILLEVERTANQQMTFQSSIRLAAHQLALSQPPPKSRVVTMFLLRDHFFVGGLELPLALQAELDEAAVLDFYADQGDRRQPTAKYNTPEFSVELRIKIWQRLLETERVNAQIPYLLGKAVTDLQAEAEAADLRTLAETALVRSISLADSLNVWRGFAGDELLGQFIDDWLAETSTQRARQGQNHWLADYLHFARDEGGAKIADAEVPLLQRVYSEIVKIARSNSELKQVAKEWLAEIALSPLRTRLSLNIKLPLCNLAQGRWNNLQTVWELYRGSEKAVTQAATLFEFERDCLLKELQEMIASQPAKDFMPSLLELQHYFGVLPAEVLRDFQMLRPSFYGTRNQNWLRGWKEIDLNVYQEELIRNTIEAEWVTRTREDSINLLQQLDEARLIQLFDKLLFEGKEFLDTRLSDRFANFAACKEQLAPIAPSIATAFDHGAKAVAKMETFWRRFAANSHALNRLVEILEHQQWQDFMAEFAEQRPEWVSNHAKSFYKNYLSSRMNFQLTAFQEAVFAFLLSPAGKEFAREIVRTENLKSVPGFLREIRELLKLSVAPRPQTRTIASKPQTSEGENTFLNKLLWFKKK